MITDLHTHILPCMDDGSKSSEMSLQMLQRESDQGVTHVVLTPHFYRHHESAESFLARREKSYSMLCNAISQSGKQFPQLRLGAEVAWVPNLPECSILEKLCIEGTHYMLLEMPFRSWNDQTINQLYDLMNKHDIIPVFAHLERYLDQPAEYLQEIISMGTPIQVSCAPLEHFMSRRPIAKMLKNHTAHFVASDCHNLTSRQPNMGMGLAAVKKILGSDAQRSVIEQANCILK